ncbi:hypothetical protein KY363_02810 [Candidatus Woesearchaeota archaeon]|nr:hypothetical protein [Candidatus Woesearchaeota archaeon]
MRRFLILIAAVALLLALAGCKEDLESSTAGSGDSQVVKKTSAEKKQSEDFRSMVMKKESLTFMAQYDISIDTQGQKQSYKTAQYLGGADKLRIDNNIQGMETRAYLLSDGYYSCRNQGGWQCFKVASKDDIGQQDYTENFKDVEKSPDDYDITYQGTMSVAGTTAQCWGITYTGQTMKYCFSSEGVPLYMEMKGPQMSYLMKASKYSTTVSESDFKLPAKAQDMQQMMEDAMKQYQGQVPEGYGN